MPAIRRNRLVGRSLVLVTGVLGLALVSSEAEAECRPIGQIFVKSTSGRHLGTKNDIKFRIRDLAAGCTYPKTLSTAHVARKFPGSRHKGDWVEIGWMQYRAGSREEHGIFVEKGRRFKERHFSMWVPFGLEPYTFDRWIIRGKIIERNGDLKGRWSLRVNPLNGIGDNLSILHDQLDPRRISGGSGALRPSHGDGGHAKEPEVLR